MTLTPIYSTIPDGAKGEIAAHLTITSAQPGNLSRAVTGGYITPNPPPPPPTGPWRIGFESESFVEPEALFTASLDGKTVFSEAINLSQFNATKDFAVPGLQVSVQIQTETSALNT
jgi:hypothetical protein